MQSRRLFGPAKTRHFLQIVPPCLDDTRKSNRFPVVTFKPACSLPTVVPSVLNNAWLKGV